MLFSTVAVASLLAAIASAEIAFPVKRSVASLSKRQAGCGAAGNCCTSSTVGKMTTYSECTEGNACVQLGGDWYCCPTGKTCEAHTSGCNGDSPYGKDYSCQTHSNGAAFYVPSDQAQAVSSAYAANTAVEQAGATVTSAAAAVSNAATSAVGAIESKASEIVSGIEAAGSSVAAAETSAAGAISSAIAEATATGGAAGGAGGAATTGNATEAPPAPTAIENSASRMLYATPALALALVAGILML